HIGVGCPVAFSKLRNLVGEIADGAEGFVVFRREGGVGSFGFFRHDFQVAEDPPSLCGRGQGEGSRFDETCFEASPYRPSSVSTIKTFAPKCVSASSILLPRSSSFVSASAVF